MGLGLTDFTFAVYESLITSLANSGYKFLTFSQFLEHEQNKQLPDDKIIILRHDVEAKYENALRIARIEASKGIRGSYYFRIYPDKDFQQIIRAIAALGHEIGYHYDDLSFSKGDVRKAIERFIRNINFLRQFGPVETITMEGAPLSKFDNKNLWNTPLTNEMIQFIRNQMNHSGNKDDVLKNTGKDPNSDGKLHYRLFGIKGEPYFDLNYRRVFYLTDTGRRWDGLKYSIRDKMPGHRKWIELGHVYHSTHDIIKTLNKNRFPPKVMITVHPQRWNDRPMPWFKEWLGQNVKNVFKLGLNMFSPNGNT